MEINLSSQTFVNYEGLASCFLGNQTISLLGKVLKEASDELKAIVPSDEKWKLLSISDTKVRIDFLTSKRLQAKTFNPTENFRISKKVNLEDPAIQ